MSLGMDLGVKIGDPYRFAVVGGGLAYVGGRSEQYNGAVGTETFSLTSLTGGIGTAPAEGDLIIIAQGWGDTVDGDPGPTSGYTEIADLYSDDTIDANLSVSYKFAGVSETSVTVPNSGNTSAGTAVAVHVWRNVDPVTPLDVSAVPATGINTGQPNPPAITPVTAGAVVIVAAHSSSDTALATTDLSNFISQQSTDTIRSALGLGSFAWTSGEFDPAVLTGSTSTSDSWAAVTFALRPA